MKFSVRRTVEQFLLAIWFTGSDSTDARRLHKLVGLLLLPLTWPVSVLSRRTRQKIVRPSPPGMPMVMVVGNLIAGGAGKSPATLAIAAGLKRAGLKVGLLCNAYRASSSAAQLVTAESTALEVGDEALVLARLSGLPVASGRHRAEALKVLCQQHPDLQLIISDDGLQHPGLARDLELAVFDARGAGNGRLIPAGPLREPLEHALQMDAILLNGTRISPIGHAREFHFSIRPHALLSLHEFSKLKPTMNSDAQPDAVDKAVKSVTAALGATVKRLLSSGNPRLVGIAGIADPQRFADTLAAIGLHCPVQALGDHAQLDASILKTIDADIIVMTTKDAVKLLNINDPRCWVLLVEAEFDPGFFPWLLATIEPLIESSTHG